MPLLYSYYIHYKYNSITKLIKYLMVKNDIQERSNTKIVYKIYHSININDGMHIALYDY